MTTLRSCALTLSGLLTGFAAAAQTNTPNAGPTPTTILSWVVWWLVGVVLLMAIITAGGAASAIQRRAVAPPAAEPTVPATSTVAPEEAYA